MLQEICWGKAARTGWQRVQHSIFSPGLLSTHIVCFGLTFRLPQVR